MGYHVSCFEFSSPSPQEVAVVNCSAILKFASEQNLLTTRNNYHMLVAGGELLSGSALRAEQPLSAGRESRLMTIRIISNPAPSVERECQ
jgi:hypothetical protein